MTTPPAQPPGSEPSDRSPDSPYGGWSAPGQFPPPPGEYPGGSPGPYPPGPYPGGPAGDYGPAGYGDQPGAYPQPPTYAGYPGSYYADPAAPYGYDPMGRPYSDKQKLVAGLLQILLGGLGIGRFYTGHTGIGVAQLLVTLFTCGLGGLWGVIDGILILVNGGTDAQGRPLRDN